MESVAGIMPDAVRETSRDRAWHGIEVMLARMEGDGLEVDRLPTHTLAINVGRPYRLAGRVDGRDAGAPMPAGAIKLVAAGPHSRWLWDRDGPIDMLHVSVSADALRAHAGELELRREPEIVTRVGFHDAELLHAGREFAVELRAAAVGSLTADALRLDVIARLLTAYSSLAGTRAIRLPDHRLPLRALRRLDEYIDAHLADAVGITELAALAGVSRFHFARTFKATTGRTPYQYVLDQRLERARRLLRYGTLSIRDVAAATGFADQSHLTRLVKRRYGVTPRAYRAT